MTPISKSGFFWGDSYYRLRLLSEITASTTLALYSHQYCCFSRFHSAYSWIDIFTIKMCLVHGAWYICFLRSVFVIYLFCVIYSLHPCPMASLFSSTQYRCLSTHCDWPRLSQIHHSVGEPQSCHPILSLQAFLSSFYNSVTPAWVRTRVFFDF